MHPRTTAGLRRTLLAFIITVSLFRTAEAQSIRCGIRGTVLDQSGVALSGAVVKAENRASAHAYATVASKAGEYSFRDLPAGSYFVTAFSPGFRVLQVPAATQVGAIGVLPLKLSRAAAATRLEADASVGVSRTAKAVETKRSGHTAHAFSGNLFPNFLTDACESQYTLCD